MRTTPDNSQPEPAPSDSLLSEEDRAYLKQIRTPHLIALAKALRGSFIFSGGEVRFEPEADIRADRSQAA